MDEQPSLSGQAGKSPFRRVLLVLTVTLSLGGVFYLYSNPQLVIMLTDQLWACF
jgi:hypothetical protein